MSAQFGKCNFDGKPVDSKDLDRVRPVLTPYGPDCEGYLCKDNVGILYRAFHTTKESRKEIQPFVSNCGAVITWDGRLDNRGTLLDLLSDEVSVGATDLSIVATAYEHWGTDSFARLIGDWAVSIWDPKSRSLVLAKDFVGTRHLYYSVEKDHAAWCTILDPLVLFAGRSFALEEEYIAGWLSFFPASHLTPYVGIGSVPPSCFVRLAQGTQQIRKYWDFNPARAIRYPNDAEYEEHFRIAFAESVRRRLRSDSPILAELSGGMDSSSIVCMADEIISRGQAETSRLDTLSYYDGNEPNWDERPYFTKVEEKRGRRGTNVDLSSQDFFKLDLGEHHFLSAPGCALACSEAPHQLADDLHSRGHRVRLSGLGGDELTGGVPDPTPELADLLVTRQFKELVRQSVRWALEQKKPWLHVIFKTVGHFMPPAMLRPPKHLQPAPWLNEAFARRNRLALLGYPRRLHMLGALPTFQMNLSILDALRRQFACSAPRHDPTYEERYPFLDRSLLEFLLAIPRSQLVRPGCRRSLMRRALSSVVPEKILGRKRKASVSRAPLATISKYADSLCCMFRNSCIGSLAVVDDEAICAAVRDASRGQQIPVVTLLRSIALETWSRCLPAGDVQRKAISAEKFLQKGGESNDLQEA